MSFRFFLRKRKSKTWKEIREEIIEAIEKEKRGVEPINSIDSTEEFETGASTDASVGSTASESSYQLKG